MRFQFEIQLESSRMLHPTCRHLRFKRADGEPMRFQPGQFIQLLFRRDDGLKRRSYSVATVPSDVPGDDRKSGVDGVEIAVSYQSGGLATGILSGIEEGDTLNAAGPFGRFCLQPDSPRRCFLVATGTGVTPYRSMLPEIARRIREENMEFVLLFGVRNHDEILYHDDFAAFAERHPGFTFHPCLSRTAEEHLTGFERAGYVQETLEQFHPDPDDDLVYLCGNPDMIDNAVARLEDHGFGARQLRREKYLAGR